MASPQCQLADSHLRITNVIQHQRLNVVDVGHAGTLELELYKIKKKAVSSFHHRNKVAICLDIHCTFPLTKPLQNGQPATAASAANTNVSNICREFKGLPKMPEATPSSPVR